PIILCCLLALSVGLIMASCSFGGSASAPTTQSTPTAGPAFTPKGLIHAHGAQLVDANGHPFELRGAQIESPFNYIKNWESGKRPSVMLNSTVFNVMVHDWKMNVLRLPISSWIYAKDTTDYMSQLDQVVQEANTAGLYVVLDLHDNVKSGSPYGE